jgi:hypothetical protein
VKSISFKLSLAICIFLFFFSSCKDDKTERYGPDIYQPDTQFKVVGYLMAGGFSMMDELELDRLTYLNLAFANPGTDGKLVFDDIPDIGPAVTKGHAAGLKVFVSIAGGGTFNILSWQTVLKKENRPAFIRNIIEYVEKYNLDGVDVDIEGNLIPSIGETYTPFVVELREALHSKGKGISSALGPVSIYDEVHQEALEAYDFINVMAYDLTGIWTPNQPGPHSPYSLAEDAIQFWTVEKGIAPEKIILGVPFYGHDFNPPVRYITYRELVTTDVNNAYADESSLIYYNGIPTIVKKAELARKELGGIMIWEISYDAQDDLSLLRAIDQTLKAGSCNVSTFFRDEDADGFGNPSKPMQACLQPSGYVTNRDDQDDTNNLVHP